MKIIKRPKERKEPKNWSKRFKCECGATLLVKKNDLFLDRVDGDSDGCGGSSWYVGFICPCCEDLNDVSDTTIPVNVTQSYADWLRKNKKRGH